MGHCQERRFVLGVGCESGAPADQLRALVERALREAGIEPREVAAIASIDTRRDEVAIVAAAESLGVPVHFFDAITLERETPKLKNPSQMVFSRLGCHGVAEAAALAAAGPEAELVLPKIKSALATAAVAQIP
jgi:cobalt-precorrin 5A hydrolase